MDLILNTLQRFGQFLSEPETLRIFVSNRFLMILLVIFLLKIKYKTYSNIYLSALVNIPGTLLHETAHFITGLVLNAQPTKFTIVPQKRIDGYVMGSVGFRNIQFYNALPSALAPLSLLVIGYFFNKWFFENVTLNYLNYIAYIFLQTVIIENALPSAQDFKVAFSKPLGILLYGFIFFLLVLYF